MELGLSSGFTKKLCQFVRLNIIIQHTHNTHQSELYSMLVATGADLFSCIDNKSMIRAAINEQDAKIKASEARRVTKLDEIKAIDDDIEAGKAKKSDIEERYKTQHNEQQQHTATNNGGATVKVESIETKSMINAAIDKERAEIEAAKVQIEALTAKIAAHTASESCLIEQLNQL